jgi:hypothetical protein
MAQSVLNALLKQPQFSNKITEFAKQIASANSIREAFDIYEKCHFSMDGWTFIFSSPIGSARAFAVNRKFANGSGVFAMFKESGVAMLDPQFFAAAKRGQSAKFQIDYSISLDTQVLSYLQTFVNSGRKGAADFEEVLQFIADPAVNCDPTPYLLENTMADRIPEEKILTNLTAWQTLKNLDFGLYQRTGVLLSLNGAKAAEREAEALLSDWITDTRFPSAKNAADSLLHRNMVLLTKIVLIQWQSKGKSLEYKLAVFCDYMNEHGAIAICFARIATEFFSNGTNCAFFGKIQVESTPVGLYEKLKAMAWDLMHWERLVEGFSAAPFDKARISFPAILSFDKSYLSLLDCLALRAIAIKEGESNSITVYDGPQLGKGTEDFSDKFGERYFNNEAIKERELIRKNQTATLDFSKILDAQLHELYLRLKN